MSKCSDYVSCCTPHGGWFGVAVMAFIPSTK